MKTLNQLNKEYPDLTSKCLSDIKILRSRFNWDQDLEDKLIILHAKGEPPNMLEYGITKSREFA